jgi:DNA-binding NtrC family response regulator
MLSSQAVQARRDRQSLHVLVVDDEALIRWSVAETLADEGHWVAEADNGAVALEILAEDGPFDVVLLDYHLPDSNDLALLRGIRQLAPRAAVVMMTAFGTQDMIEESLRLGVYRVVSKPFDVNDIASLVWQAYKSASR